MRETLRICPICLYIPSRKEPGDIRECFYCKVPLDITDVPESKRTNKVYKLISKYEKNPKYDPKARLESMKRHVEMIRQLEQPSTPTLTTCPVCDGKLSTAATACPHCGQPMNQGKPVQTVQQTPAQPQSAQTGPKCPTCNSKNISEIGYLDRLTSVMFWGLASRKMGKQFSCNDCGYKW